MTAVATSDEQPDVDAYRALAERDADGAEVRTILDVLPTEALARVEALAVRLIRACRDVRHSREARS